MTGVATKEEKVELGRGEPGPASAGPELVEFRGLLPRQPVQFLSRLAPEQRKDVFTLLGTFGEVRGLVGAGRLLHAYLSEAPFAAARGRITLREFISEKDALQGAIFDLRRKLNRAAEAIRLILPVGPARARGVGS